MNYQIRPARSETDVATMASFSMLTILETTASEPLMLTSPPERSPSLAHTASAHRRHDLSEADRDPLTS